MTAVASTIQRDSEEPGVTVVRKKLRWPLLLGLNPTPMVAFLIPPNSGALPYPPAPSCPQFGMVVPPFAAVGR